MDEILREIRSFVASLVADGIHEPDRLIEDATESFEIEHRRGDLKPFIEQIAAEEIAQRMPVVPRSEKIELVVGLRGHGNSEIGLVLRHEHDPASGTIQGELRLAYRLDSSDADAATNLVRRVLALGSSNVKEPPRLAPIDE